MSSKLRSVSAIFVYTPFLPVKLLGDEEWLAENTFDVVAAGRRGDQLTTIRSCPKLTPVVIVPGISDTSRYPAAGAVRR